MAGDRRATAGYSIASRRIEKVFPADDYSGVAIAGAAGPGGRDGEALPGAARALREGAGRRAQPRRQGQSARPARARQPARRDAGVRGRAALRGLRRRPRDAAGCSRYDVTGGRYEELDYQSQGSGSVHARNWIKAGWREGMALDEIDRPRDHVAVRGGRRGRRNRRPRPRAPHLPDGRDHRRRGLPRARPTTRSRRAARPSCRSANEEEHES